MGTKQIEVKFFTKQQKYALPNFPISVPADVKDTDLDSLIKGLLVEHFGLEARGIEFDFIVVNEFLRLPLCQHLENREVSTESVIEIEYVEKVATPSPRDGLIHNDWVSSVQANDDWILTGCYDNMLHIWSLDGEHKLTIPGHMQSIKGVTWLRSQDKSNSQQVFVSASFDQTAMVWVWRPELNSVDCISVCRGHANTVVCVASEESGHKFATGSWDKMIKIWSSQPDEGENIDNKRRKTEAGTQAKTRTPIMTLSGHREVISAVEWLGPNEVCSASWDHTIRTWDVEMGGMKSQMVGTKNFNDISFSNLNRLLISGSTDRHVRLWDPRLKDSSVVQRVYTSHNGWVTCVNWSMTDHNQFISGSHDSILKLWDMRSCKVPVFDMAGHENQILCCDWSNKNCMLSGGSDNQLKIFKCT